MMRRSEFQQYCSASGPALWIAGSSPAMTVWGGGCNSPRDGNSERRDGLHLDQRRLQHQPVDHQERVRRIEAVRKHLREFAQAILHEVRDVLRVHEIGRELYDIAPAR